MVARDRPIVMTLTPLQRNLISRGTALAIGLWLGYIALGCLRWGEGLRTDQATQQWFNGRPARRVSTSGNPMILPYALCGLTGLASLALVGFAIVPVSVLHRISPETWQLPETWS